ncbi:MAG: TlpA family protein disulfide reductase [Lachnospiraceae bacterium]|jgi:thiol-disulfide isomerase/thioredoxin|nr:TlpA family protein disulfide reductase [Lachnospiraceae bacterium]
MTNSKLTKNRGFLERRRFIKGRRAAVWALGVTFLCGIAVSGCGKGQTDLESPKIEETEAETAPENQEDRKQEERVGLGTFTAITVDGQTVTQEDIAKKDATLLNFWATYCGPCIEELPEIARLAESLPENVQIMTVCLDAGTDTDAAEKILAEAGFEGMTLVSGDGGLAEVVGGIMYTPTTIVVDAEGYIVGDAVIGGQEHLAEVYTAAINEALKASGKAEITYAGE